jgi:hypothetical protein
VAGGGAVVTGAGGAVGVGVPGPGIGATGNAGALLIGVLDRTTAGLPPST